MRAVYLDKYVGQLRESEHIYENEIFSNEKSFQKISKIISQSTYIYPRVHSALKLVIFEAMKEPTAMKILGNLHALVVNSHFCNNNVYQALKSNTRPKFLNIGLKFSAMILQAANDSQSTKDKDLVINSVQHQDFLRVFVKNYQSHKSPLFDAATEVKAQLLTLIKDCSSKHAN